MKSLYSALALTFCLQGCTFLVEEASLATTCLSIGEGVELLIEERRNQDSVPYNFSLESTRNFLGFHQAIFSYQTNPRSSVTMQQEEIFELYGGNITRTDRDGFSNIPDNTQISAVQIDVPSQQVCLEIRSKQSFTMNTYRQ